jgi:hypothetical protein
MLHLSTPGKLEDGRSHKKKTLPGRIPVNWKKVQDKPQLNGRDYRGEPWERRGGESHRLWAKPQVSSFINPANYLLMPAWVLQICQICQLTKLTRDLPSRFEGGMEEICGAIDHNPGKIRRTGNHGRGKPGKKLCPAP